MNYIEYGRENKEVIILLHGGGLSWWNYREVAEMLKSHYHVILPILDGHSKSDHSFISIEKNAERIIEFIDKYYRGSVLLIGGLSLGGQILVEILSQRSHICTYAIIESVLIIPRKFTHYLIEPTIKISYPLIKQMWFAKLQFQSLRIKQELFDDYYKDTCNIKITDMISFLKANSWYKIKESLNNTHVRVFIFVGEKEQSKIIKSAYLLNQIIPDSILEIKKNMYHGDYSINFAREYVNNILKIITS